VPQGRSGGRRGGLASPQAARLLHLGALRSSPLWATLPWDLRRAAAAAAEEFRSWAQRLPPSGGSHKLRRGSAAGEGDAIAQYVQQGKRIRGEEKWVCLQTRFRSLRSWGM